jgi:hypothetical protein
MGKRAARGLLLLAATAAFAHDPITTRLTWSKEISRVVYRRCASCHRPDGRAFSLLTYEDARPWAKGIRDEVLSRRMPPWDAVKGVGEFRNDAGLSLPEMDLIVNWVEGGAPEGDAVYLPPKPRSETPQPETGVGAEFRGTSTLSAERMLRGIRPLGTAEVAAVLPGGDVRRLLWVRNFRPEWNRTYWLRTPERLPRGTSIVITGGPVQLFW